MSEKVQDVQAWRREVFLPWKEAMVKYNDERGQQLKKLRSNVVQLETIVALLMEGKSRQAMLAWNTLELHPKLREMGVSADGETLRLVDASGDVTVLRLDDLMSDLQKLMTAPEAPPVEGEKA